MPVHFTCGAQFRDYWVIIVAWRVALDGTLAEIRQQQCRALSAPKKAPQRVATFFSEVGKRATISGIVCAAPAFASFREKKKLKLVQDVTYKRFVFYCSLRIHFFIVPSGTIWAQKTRLKSALSLQRTMEEDKFFDTGTLVGIVFPANSVLHWRKAGLRFPLCEKRRENSASYPWKELEASCLKQKWARKKNE